MRFAMILGKTARSQIYKEMLKHLPGITLGNLPYELKKSVCYLGKAVGMLTVRSGRTGPRFGLRTSPRTDFNRTDIGPDH